MAFLEKAKLRKLIGDNWGAKKDFKLAEKLIKDYETGLNALNEGMNQFVMENFEEAEKKLNIAIHLNFESANIYFYRGLSRKQLGTFRKSVEDFHKAIILNPLEKEIYQSHIDNCI